MCCCRCDLRGPVTPRALSQWAYGFGIECVLLCVLWGPQSEGVGLLSLVLRGAVAPTAPIPLCISCVLFVVGCLDSAGSEMAFEEMNAKCGVGAMRELVLSLFWRPCVESSLLLEVVVVIPLLPPRTPRFHPPLSSHLTSNPPQPFWAEMPEEMSDAFELHHQLIRNLIAEHNGYEVKTIGDVTFMVAFKTVPLPSRLGQRASMTSTETRCAEAWKLKERWMALF